MFPLKLCEIARFNGLTSANVAEERYYLGKLLLNSSSWSGIIHLFALQCLPSIHWLQKGTGTRRQPSRSQPAETTAVHLQPVPYKMSSLSVLHLPQRDTGLMTLSSAEQMRKSSPGAIALSPQSLVVAHRVKATRLLTIRALSLQEIWDSNHCHLNTLAFISSSSCSSLFNFHIRSTGIPEMFPELHLLIR